MVTPTDRPYVPMALGDVMRMGARNPQTTDSTPETVGRFNTEIAQALARPVERFYVDGTPERQNPGGAAENGQNPSRNPGATTAALALTNGIDQLPLIPSDTQNRKFTDYEDPTPLVRDELRKLGISPDGLQFERWDDEIANWGGHFTNHLLRVNTGGRAEDFSIELALRSPRVTAVEIANLIQGGLRAG